MSKKPPQKTKALTLKTPPINVKSRHLTYEQFLKYNQELGGRFNKGRSVLSPEQISGHSRSVRRVDKNTQNELALHRED